jgi:transcriptional regulator with XRE-family HTH domain
MGVAELEEGTQDVSYAQRVGVRLRAIRKQKGLSLQEVEAASTQEFKASVLGAYERGERAISVPRLQRLARFYHVPVDQLLPREEPEADEVVDLDAPAETARMFDQTITIDLVGLERLDAHESELIGRYLHMIQVQRGDFNGRMLTIRRDDMRAIAALLEIPPEAAARRLDDMGLRLRP